MSSSLVGIIQADTLLAGVEIRGPAVAEIAQPAHVFFTLVNYCVLQL